MRLNVLLEKGQNDKHVKEGRSEKRNIRKKEAKQNDIVIMSSTESVCSM